MRKLVDFIHVGDYKTGTTWLQETVFPLHLEIQYLGDHFQNEKLQEVLRELVDIRDLDFDANKLKEKFEKNFQRQNGKIVGLSREALSQSNYITGEHSKRNAERLKEVFGEVKIIYVIREQISMLSSLYSQYVKTGGTRSFKDWFLDPIECKGIIDRLQYHKNIQMYYDIFGKENVLVLLFEELKKDKKSFLEKIYRHIGCENINFQPKESNKVVNKSLTNVGAFVARFLNSFFRNSYHNYKNTFLNIDKIIYLLLSEEKKDKIYNDMRKNIVPHYIEFDKRQIVLYAINMALQGKVRNLSEKINIGRKLDIPKEIKQKILPYFKDSNQILQKKYNLNVNKFGWSL